METTLTFSMFFQPPKHRHVCHSCLDQLKPTEGKTCSICGTSSRIDTCSDCLQWKKRRPHLDTLHRNRSIFSYTDLVQKIFAQWKYRGDYELGFLFKPFVETYFHQKSILDKETVVVPIPLSKERLYERAFNQAEMIAKWITPQPALLLTREHHEKQAKKSKRERISSKNPFILSKSINNPVLLVDDIYTTGTTLRQASAILKENGCPKVDAFTLVRS